MKGQPDDSKHWASRQERGVYFGLKAMLLAYRLFGAWLFVPLLHFVVAYFFLTSPSSRRSSRQFLNAVWRSPGGREAFVSRPSIVTSYRHFLSFGRAGMDKLASWMGKIDVSQIDYVNRELFERRVEQRRGGIWIASHLGNMEVCRALGRHRSEVKINALVHTMHAANFNRVLNEANPDSQLELIQIAEFDMVLAMKLQQKVSDGELLVIMGDRTPVSGDGHVVWAEFLGRPAPFPEGPFVLASILDCPVGLLFCCREKDRFRVIFEDFAIQETARRRDRDRVLVNAVERFAQRLECHAKRYPLQWFNFFDFWSHDGHRESGAFRQASEQGAPEPWATARDGLTDR